MVFLTFCATKSQMQRDSKKQSIYAILTDDRSGLMLLPTHCRHCRRGFEPVPQCGTIIGIDDSIGLCQICKPGYFSAAEDYLPCQPCESSKCSRHEIIEGSCMATNDTSRCTGHCKDGYIMNSTRTCEAVKQQPSTTKSSVVITAVLGILIALFFRLIS